MVPGPGPGPGPGVPVAGVGLSHSTTLPLQYTLSVPGPHLNPNNQSSQAFILVWNFHILETQTTPSSLDIIVLIS